MKLTEIAVRLCPKRMRTCRLGRLGLMLGCALAVLWNRLMTVLPVPSVMHRSRIRLLFCLIVLTVKSVLVVRRID